LKAESLGFLETLFSSVMALLEVCLKERLFWRYTLHQDETRIGRGSENDLVLTDPLVSRLHAVVLREADHFVIIDRSTNGTFVNKERIDRVLLSNEDRIEIGDFTLTYHSESPSRQSAEKDASNHQTTIIRAYNERTNRLTFEKFFLIFCQKGKTHRFPVDKTRVRIGSARENDITIQDPSVSRYHAVIQYREEQFQLRDLNSAEGTYLHEKQVQEAILTAGSTVRFGKVEVEFASATEGAMLTPIQESPYPAMAGHSPQMRKIYALIKKVSASNAPILVQGETGTGKELVARAIHALGDRANGPFVVINCGAIPKNLIESEFFGHKKGAFTGSDAERAGAFERAHKGTIFLDEIGELPLDLQPRLLRVIEDKSVTRVGGNEPQPTDFRLVTATNRKLEEEVPRGNFRQDLYFRIGVVPITLPPLRERKEDIPVLLEHVLKAKAQEMGRAPTTMKISNMAKTKLMMHDWPGNVRELRNVIERALLMTDKDEIDAEDLTFTPISRDEVEEVLVKGDLSLEEVEKRVILHTLKAHNWDKKITAEVLGVAYSTLWAKLKKYNITA